jgi:hypothetical protein
MPTERQKANLRRGGAPANTESARRARDGKAALKANDERLAKLAVEDPHKPYDELHGIMTRSILKLLRQEERSGGKPSRDVTDRLREYRPFVAADHAPFDPRVTATVTFVKEDS